MTPKIDKFMKAILAISAICLSTPAQAGFLFSFGLGPHMFSFRPELDEATPNYYAVSPDMTVGYSVRQVFDIGLYTTYAPGTRGSAEVGSQHASLVTGGLELGARIHDQVFIALRGGMAQYHLINASDDAEVVEVEGRWQGPTGGLILGSIFKQDKRNFWQLHFMVTSASLLEQNLEEPDDPDAKPVIRVVDTIALGVKYTFNGFFNHFVQNTLFNDIF